MALGGMFAASAEGAALLALVIALQNVPEGFNAWRGLAAGGILYLTFQDIAPQSRLERHWAPPLGAVLGFGLAALAETVFP